jgi:hypothetical protein
VPEQERPTIAGITAIILIAVFMWLPLYKIQSPHDAPRIALSYPGHANNPASQTQPSQRISETATPSDNDAGGIKQIQADQCYKGETVGECTARNVQAQVVIFYAVLSFIAFLQFAVAGLTWCLLRRQSEIQPRLERAYIFATVLFNGDSLHHVNESDMRCDMRVEFVNHGRTPAVVLRIVADVSIGTAAPQKLPKTEEWQNLILPGTVIPPGKKEDVLTFKIVNGREIASLDKPTKWLYLLGRIEYEDVLGKPHTTSFCWQYGAIGIGRDGPTIAPNTPLNYRT